MIRLALSDLAFHMANSRSHSVRHGAVHMLELLQYLRNAFNTTPFCYLYYCTLYMPAFTWGRSWKEHVGFSMKMYLGPQEYLCLSCGYLCWELMLDSKWTICLESVGCICLLIKRTIHWHDYVLCLSDVVLVLPTFRRDIVYSATN